MAVVKSFIPVEFNIPHSMAILLLGIADAANGGLTQTYFKLEWEEGSNYCETSGDDKYDEDNDYGDDHNYMYRVEGRFQEWTLTKSWRGREHVKLVLGTREFQEFLLNIKHK